MPVASRNDSAAAALRLIGLLAIVPVLAFFVAVAVDSKYESDLVSVIESQIGRTLTAEERASVSMQELCQDPQAAKEAFCGDEFIAAVDKPLAIGLIVALVVGLGLIALAKRTARKDPRAVMRIFLPGLYITQAVVILMMLVVGVLALSVIYLVPAVFAGRIVPGLLFIVVLAVGAGIVGTIAAILRIRTRIRQDVLGYDLREDDQPELFAFVRDIAERVGADPPDRIVLGLEPAFYVTEADINSLDGERPGRTLFLSAPMCRLLSRAELEAVVGHEMAHFHGRDTELSRRFFPIYRAAGSSFDSILASSRGWTRVIVLAPLLLIARFLDAFDTAVAAISRDREVAADALGAQVAQPLPMASSLVKMHRYSGRWQTTLETLVHEVDQTDLTTTNASKLFLTQSADAAATSDQAAIDLQELGHPTNTHPPLSQRLAALSVTFDEADAFGRSVEAGDESATIITGLTESEERLTDAARFRLERLLGRPRATHPIQAPGLEEATSVASDASPGGSVPVRLYDPYRSQFIGATFDSHEEALRFLRLGTEMGKDVRNLKPKEFESLVARFEAGNDAQPHEVTEHRFQSASRAGLNRCETCGLPGADPVHGQLRTIPVSSIRAG